MNILKKLLPLLGLIGLSALPTMAETLSLSREECVEIALRDNPTVRIADMEVKKVNYAKKETLAGVFPSIDFSGAYQRSIELQTIRMNMGGQSQSLKMGSDNTWNMGFSASMPLIAPTLWKAISISDTQILANLENARASRLDLVNNVNKAYYALMLAISSHEVVKQNYDIALMNAEIYEKQHKAGTASEYDVLRSSVQVKNIEPELLQADIAIRQCSLQLKVLMGIAADTEIVPKTTLKDYQSGMYAYPTGADTSIEGNTSLRSLDIQKKILDKNIDLKKFAWIPTLAASFNLSWLSLSNGSPFKNQEFNPFSNVGLALSVPIFSGGSKYYGLKQAQVQRKELDLQRENLVNSLNMQVELAIDNINREAKQISTSEEGVRQAAKAYQIMQKSFEIGAASYLDLRDSELANTAAQLTYLQAIYNYLVSTSELDMLLGKGIE
ncbi:MAG: TolC family protein [Muribaculaceae bacterium]|nr:TolC family protein [Muribaculaceae bacterium]